ncbi:hypothetical protein [Paraburkholderia sp. BR10882]|uniref:hypothetical protein n=1 Tax=unclassified Paraburkholderia TaxID=2615204 RepID=UPI0034CD7E71
MASAKDYVGFSFPPFQIEERIGAGYECEVYRVRNEGTGRSFALRLPGREESLWIEGIALYGGRIVSDKGQLNRLEAPIVDEIVIGSPIFVRQRG